MLDAIDIILHSKNLVVFTGAGMSTASGIPDFRSSTGLYQNKTNEEILSHHFFMEKPDVFYDFYKEKMVHQEAKPNIGHQVLAKLEKKGIVKAIITQNIDTLHEDALSVNVLKLHGTIKSNTCLNCGFKYDLDYILNNDYKFKCGGIIKPDVVLYEEALDDDIVRESIDYIEKADTLLVMGTSLNVYPAASLIRYFKGKNLIIINKDKTPSDYLADIVINDDIVNVFTKLDEYLT